jgi:hypothetical protein
LAAIAPGATSATDTVTPGGRSLSQTGGHLVFAAIMLFAAIDAARQLGFMLVAGLIVTLRRARWPRYIWGASVAMPVRDASSSGWLNCC